MKDESVICLQHGLNRVLNIRLLWTANLLVKSLWWPPNWAHLTSILLGTFIYQDGLLAMAGGCCCVGKCLLKQKGRRSTSDLVGIRARWEKETLHGEKPNKINLVQCAFSQNTLIFWFVRYVGVVFPSKLPQSIEITDGRFQTTQFPCSHVTHIVKSSKQSLIVGDWYHWALVGMLGCWPPRRLLMRTIPEPFYTITLLYLHPFTITLSYYYYNT